jgi:radical SAM protein (TIGR01212 family)
MEQGIRWLRGRFNARKFLAYFQSFTNTYASPDRLRLLYDQALAFPDVVGMCIGTRPDCVPEPVLDLLAEYHRRRFVMVELGLESVRNDTLATMNRGHTVEEFRDAVRRTRARHLPVCAHLILGIPGEGRNEIRRAAEELNRLRVEGVKIHLLHILRNSPLERVFYRDRFPLLERGQYVSYVVDLLERLRADIVIHRLTGEAPPDRLVAPLWCLDKNGVVEAIRKEMERRQTWQGKKIKPIRRSD